MSKYRIPRKKSKYYLPKEEYLTAVHYSLRYPSLLAEYNAIADTSGTIRYDQERVQTSGSFDSTESAGIRLAEIKTKLNIIDTAIKETSKEFGEYLRMGVCYGFTFEQLKGKGMPCEHAKYYRMRREYLYKLAKKI